MRSPVSANDNSQPSDGGCKSKSPGNDPLLLEVVDDMCSPSPQTVGTP